MQQHFKNTIIKITALAVIFLFSCDDRLDQVRKMDLSSNEPIGEVENMFLKHTDNELLQVTMQGPLMLDYSNDAFPYTSFPQGVEIEVYDYKNEEPRKTRIFADKAIAYDMTNLIDLQGNVRIINYDGTTFKGEQLYWDQDAQWVLTDVPSTTQLPNRSLTSRERLDAAQDISIVRARYSNDAIRVNKEDE